MSESYTVGGDAYALATRSKWAGQTFRPVQDHILEWIDLNLKLPAQYPPPSLQVFNAGFYHTPVGDPISRDIWWDLKYTIPYKTYRVRFHMGKVKLYKDSYYCIVLIASSMFPALEPEWLYDKDDATYPRGLRIYSSDSGQNWTQYYNDDHIFVEFGTPPAPTPPPHPPIPNFAILDIQQEETATGYKITIATNAPCHLYMYYTLTKPDLHHRTMVFSGVTMPAASQWCFTAWKKNEQEEPGDTLYHTFIKEPWPLCETRWFTFRAKIDGTWSKSCGPIFMKHSTVIPFTLIISEPWTVVIQPPPMTIVIQEPWTVDTSIPEMERIILEPWTS